MDLTAINGEVISGNGSNYIPKEADVEELCTEPIKEKKEDKKDV